VLYYVFQQYKFIYKVKFTSPMKMIDWKKLFGITVFTGCFGIVSWMFCYRISLTRIAEMVERHGYELPFYFGLTVAVLTAGFMLFQAILVCFYKPASRWPADRPLPGCTVIVPAYNEGSAVADTLRSLLKSDYPADKLEIIAINDGSKDDTWNWIKLAAGESNGLIRAINLEKNGGKKAALYRGFHEAKHELVITIDSDSIVESSTIANLVLPFADSKVGGAAGTVRVANINQGFIPKMLDIFFVFSCDFLRCGQSTIGAVLCSPGAISAFRKSALLPHLDMWLNQTFCGLPSHIGEDRALTSILLRNGYHVVLQKEAQITTNVPTDYPQLCRTLIRWTRGDVREGLLMCQHFFRTFPKSWRIAALQLNLIFQLSGLILPLCSIPVLFWLIIFEPETLPMLGAYAIAICWLWATIPALLYAEKESPLKAVLAFGVGLFNLVALSWICAYSWITMRNSKWMTREVKKENSSGIASSSPRIS